MLFSRALGASIAAFLSITSTVSATPLSHTTLAVHADIPALTPVSNLTSGLGLLTFQVDNFRRNDEGARQEIIESITDAQQLVKRISYEALRNDDVARTTETQQAAKRLGDQLRALFTAIDGRRTATAPKTTSSSVDAPADARPPNVLPPTQQPALPPPQQQGGAGGGGDGDNIIEDIYSNAVSLLATIQDALPEYFWILVAAT